MIHASVRELQLQSHFEFATANENFHVSKIDESRDFSVVRRGELLRNDQSVDSQTDSHYMITPLSILLSKA